MLVGPWALAPDVMKALATALVEELPEVSAERMLAALERASSRVSPPTPVVAVEALAAMAAPEAEPEPDWEKVVDIQLARVAAADEGPDSAAILRELADDFENEIGDLDRALSARLGAFAEAAAADDLDPLLRLARATARWCDLPLDAMTALAGRAGDDASRARWFAGIAEAWERLGAAYRAADCHELVLSVAPGDQRAHDALEKLYRSAAEWTCLIELLRRRAERFDDRGRAELFRELGSIYDRELGDASAALDAYDLADRLEPDRRDVLEAMARLSAQREAHDDALSTLQRLVRLTDEPAARARLLHRAAEIAWRALHDAYTAHDLLGRARDADPDFIDVIDALAALRRERGELAGAVELLLDAARRPALADARTRLLGDAAELCATLGETARAAELWRTVRAADGADRRAAVGLAELLWQERAFDELAPLLAELCATTEQPAPLRGYLLRMGEAATARGDTATARDALARAVALDPTDPAPRRALADLHFERAAWADARALIEELLDEGEDTLPRAACVELHHRAARCARELGDDHDAAMHAAVALALDPGHRPTLLLRLDLDTGDPTALVADHLALADSAGPDEKAARFAAIGDLYAERLGDKASAREMYREALAYKPSDHLLLTKSLGLVAGDGDWAYSLDLAQRLIDTEQDPTVRARYLHLAAMIQRDELGGGREVVGLLGRACEDDPTLFAAADDLEVLLRGSTDPEPLIFFYYRRLEQLREDQGRPGELLRLWDRLGELCLGLDRRDDALCAFEVGITLDPVDPARRQRLADLYVAAGADHYGDAIAQHQAILQTAKRRTASYEALCWLYQRTGQVEKAHACEQALALIGMRAVADSGRYDVARARMPGAVIPLDKAGWLALHGPDVDLQLSALFALVAPAIAAERARTRPPQRRAPDAALPDDDRPMARVIRRVVNALDLTRPPVYVDRDQAAACGIVLRATDGVLAPALVVGRAALEDGVDERALAFTVARRLADLRPDRFARLLCPRADELTQIVQVALTLATGGDASASGNRSRAARWLIEQLHPVALDQVIGLGQRLHERRIDAGRAALDWLEATELAADRVGMVIAGDLTTCVRALEREPAAASDKKDRILELIWSSVTDEMFSVRARLERWPEPIKPRARTEGTASGRTIRRPSSFWGA